MGSRLGRLSQLSGVVGGGGADGGGGDGGGGGGGGEGGGGEGGGGFLLQGLHSRH